MDHVIHLAEKLLSSVWFGDEATALSFARDGDVLTVWKLDRLGRSLPHLIETVNALEARGVSFRSLTEAINTTTAGGRLVFQARAFSKTRRREQKPSGVRSRSGPARTARARQKCPASV